MAKANDRQRVDAYFIRDAYEVYCPECDTNMTSIPQGDKDYFRSCPNSSCDFYCRVRIEDREYFRTDWAVLIDARKWERNDDGEYESEDGGVIRKTDDGWIGEHPDLDENLSGKTLREMKVEIDESV